MVSYLMGRYRVGTRQPCRCVRLRRSAYYYRSCKDPLTARPPCGNACMNSLRHACDLDIGVFTCFCGVKAGMSARTGSIVCTARKTWLCAESVPGAMCRQHIECRSAQQVDLMRSGEWISWQTSFRMVAGSEH